MEVLVQIATLLGAGCTVVGGFIAFNALYQLADERSKGRPSDGTEWWTLVKGALLAAVGASGLIVSQLENLHF